MFLSNNFKIELLFKCMALYSDIYNEFDKLVISFEFLERLQDKSLKYFII